jgi:GT2 family glycosyltransferase
MDKLLSTHEVSAVTGACLAIEKVKFDAVGGFDDVNLPVDLNDIDLCLRLSQRGWKTLYIPAAVLIHKESASRGRTADHAHRYPREIAYFRSRWGGALHDDPYFHPALSLNAQRTLLS